MPFSRLLSKYDFNKRQKEPPRQIDPHHIWKESIPPLEAWLSDDHKVNCFPRTVNTSFDFLEQNDLGDLCDDISFKRIKAMREATEPNRKLCILATARNEGLYILDWLAYHRALGVEDFFIYTNDNEDASNQLLTALNDAGYIRLIFNQVGGDVRPQIKAYGHALQILPEILTYKWTAIIDLDEYIMIDQHKYNSINEFLTIMDRLGTDSIALPWTWHDPCGRTIWEDVPVNVRFPKYRPDHFGKHVKSIIKTNRFVHSQCHFPIDDPLDPRIYRSPDGSLAEAGPYATSVFGGEVWVGHHLFKSLEELVVRRSRNSGDRATSDISGETLYTNFIHVLLDKNLWFDEATNLSLDLDKDLFNKAEAEKKLIKTDHNVRVAEDLCKAWFKSESARVRSKLRQDARFCVPGSIEARALDLLDYATQ